MIMKDGFGKGGRANARFQRTLVPCAADQCIDLTDGSDENTPVVQQPTTAHQVSVGAVHVLQRTQDVYAGSLNRTLEEPVSVYAQSDTVFRACLQLQTYLIEHRQTQHRRHAPS